MKKEISGAGVTLVKIKSSGAGATFIRRRDPAMELRHFYDGSAALLVW